MPHARKVGLVLGAVGPMENSSHAGTPAALADAGWGARDADVPGTVRDAAPGNIIDPQVPSST